jgi:hypothetical protein
VADRKAAERVGTLITGLNDSSARWSDSDKAWIGRSPNADAKFSGFKSLREIAPYYKFEVDLLPWYDGVKWELNFNCVRAQSGKGKGFTLVSTIWKLKMLFVILNCWLLRPLFTLPSSCANGDR